jgi:hypothetical protein
MGLGSGIRDPGSGKNLFRIPDPGVKKAPDPGSGSATLAVQIFNFSDYSPLLIGENSTNRCSDFQLFSLFTLAYCEKSTNRCSDFQLFSLVTLAYWRKIDQSLFRFSLVLFIS